MLSRGFADGVAPGHAGDFLYPLGSFDGRDARGGAFPARPLLHPEVPLRAGGDLGQVGDAHDLVMRGELREAPADPIGHPPADPGVDLVEDEDHPRVGLAHGLLDGEKGPRELAPGGDLAQRARRLAGVGREAELRPLASERAARVTRWLRN